MGLPIIVSLVGVGIVCVVAGFLLSGERIPDKPDSGPRMGAEHSRSRRPITVSGSVVSRAATPEMLAGTGSGRKNTAARTTPLKLEVAPLQAGHTHRRRSRSIR
jgi:hypothetical protein